MATTPCSLWLIIIDKPCRVLDHGNSGLSDASIVEWRLLHIMKLIVTSQLAVQRVRSCRMRAFSRSQCWAVGGAARIQRPDLRSLLRWSVLRPARRETRVISHPRRLEHRLTEGGTRPDGGRRRTSGGARRRRHQTYRRCVFSFQIVIASLSARLAPPTHAHNKHITRNISGGCACGSSWAGWYVCWNPYILHLYVCPYNM